MKYLITIFFAFSFLGLSSVPLPVAAETAAVEPIEPKLQVPIPGIDFSGSVLHGGTVGTDDCGAGEVCVDVLGIYLNAVFRYAVGAAVLLTIVLIMIGGIEYMVGSAAGGVARAKKRMQNAAMGLILTLSVYVIVAFVNPDITNTGTLVIEVAQPAEEVVAQLEEDLLDLGGTPAYSDAVDLDGNALNLATFGNRNVVSAGPGLAVHQDILEKIQLIAVRLNTPTTRATLFGSRTVPGSKLLITRAWEDPDRSARKFYDDCIRENTNCHLACNPFPRDATSPIEEDGNGGWQLKSGIASQIQADPETEAYHSEARVLLGSLVVQGQTFACPYNTGYAVDAWCQQGRRGFVVDSKCQLELEGHMRRSGFCRVKEVPWRFEYAEKAVTPSAVSCDWENGVLYHEGTEFNYGEECTDTIGTDPVNLLNSARRQRCNP